MKFSIRQCALFLSVLLFPLTSWAFRVAPMTSTFTPEGKGSNQVFVIENTESHKISVDVAAFHRFKDVNGNEKRAPTDEFSVYPQELTLRPKEKRKVRVTWMGQKHPDRELNYRLVISQLPEHFRKEKKGPTFLVQYYASLYVTPPGAKADVSVSSFVARADGTGALVLKNSGRAHRLLKGLRLFLCAKGKRGEIRREIDGAQIQQIRQENILALSSRRFRIELPRQLLTEEKGSLSKIAAKIEFSH